MDVAWRQHDVYGDALRVIVRTCHGYGMFARRLLNDELHEAWGQIRRVDDHRTLQWTHDLLAAVWRHDNFPQQASFAFAAKAETGDLEAKWLAWLKAEVESWIDYPWLIRLVMTILSNQNVSAGYVAESEIGLALLRRFARVPWRKDIGEAFKAGLERESAKALSRDSDPIEIDEIEEFPEGGLCECASVGRAPCSQIPCKTTCERAAREGWGPLE
ncbi:hypothetical protein [Aminobacter sp. HY435]|uniref:hypothetical protein n=1 Tax=Aminobacter sp. HY435 TaxID=2970917 RepID=UPI0022B98203|nr:hypothetical protein [Aminobacter sp. HY435]